MKGENALFPEFKFSIISSLTGSGKKKHRKKKFIPQKKLSPQLKNSYSLLIFRTDRNLNEEKKKGNIFPTLAKQVITTLLKSVYTHCKIAYYNILNSRREF